MSPQAFLHYDNGFFSPEHVFPDAINDRKGPEPRWYYGMIPLGDKLPDRRMKEVGTSFLRTAAGILMDWHLRNAYYYSFPGRTPVPCEKNPIAAFVRRQWQNIQERRSGRPMISWGIFE